MSDCKDAADEGGVNPCKCGFAVDYELLFMNFD